LASNEAIAAQSSATMLEKANIAKEGQVEAADKRKQATESAAMASLEGKNNAVQADLIKSVRNV
jgi:hypothetical protein